MFKIACLMMQRDEKSLLEPWIKYHADIFGLENLYIWDNGSKIQPVLDILAHYAKKGLNIVYDHNTPLDFRRKGVLLGNKIKELDAARAFDFYLPLDCDEFLAIQAGKETFSIEKDVLLKNFESLAGEEHALGVRNALYNILGHKGNFISMPHKKTFFYKDTFKQMDHGYHEGISKKHIEPRLTNFVYIHYHYKPHSVQVEHSKNKVAPYFDVEDPEVLKTLYEKNRLVRFMLDDEETYLKQFNLQRAIPFPAFAERLRALGSDIPF